MTQNGPFAIECDKQKMFEDAVVIVADQSYFPAACFLASQIDDLECGRKFDICIVGPAEMTLPKGLQESARFLILKSKESESFRTDERITLAAYVRIFLPELLSEYRRIVYLDADTYLRRPGLSNLFSADLNGSCLGAVRDSNLWGAMRKRRAFRYYTNRITREAKDPDKYFNSGVLVMDTSLFRRDLPAKDIPPDLERNKHLLSMHDQTYLNLKFSHQYRMLNPRYNFPMSDEYIDIVEEANPILLHFVANHKPWYKTDIPIRRDYFSEYAPFLAENFGISDFSINKFAHIDRFAKRKYKNPIREYLSRSAALLRLKLAKRQALKSWYRQFSPFGSDNA